jgi:hypothetical protein
MKRIRLPVLVAGALVFVVGLALLVAFSSSFQTWAARRWMAARPGMEVTVGSVSAGLKRVELKNLHYVQSGAVLTIPSLELDVPLIAAAWSEDVQIKRLVAKGWTLDLSKRTPPPAGAAPLVSGAQQNQQPAAPGGRAAAPRSLAPAEVFSGLLGRLNVPVDLSVDDVELEGDVILPPPGGKVAVTLKGGGLGMGREGRFQLAADATLNQESVKGVQLRGDLLGMMDTPRSFRQLGARLDGTATGERFSQGVKLHTDLVVARVDTGETYEGSVKSGAQELIAVSAVLPRSAGNFSGAWKVNFREQDVAPFAAGQPLPIFTSTGEGTFDADTRFEAIHLSGRLDGTVAQLQSLVPALGTIGELKVTADFDVAEREGALTVQRLEVAARGSHPVATLRALQPFEFNFGTGDLRTADPTQDLVSVALDAVPVGWVAPFVPDLHVEGSTIRGALVANSRAGGVTVRSTSPVNIGGLAIAQSGKPLLKEIDLVLNASGDYTPKGWQAEISGFKATSGGATLLSLDAKMGQLAGTNQPLKATAVANGNLAALLAQPAAAGSIGLISGDARAELVVSLEAKKELQANVTLENLATNVETKAVKLPALSTHLRADIGPDGKITFNAPLLIERGERKSDLTVIGSIGAAQNKLRAIDAEVTSNQLIVDDAQAFALVLPADGSAIDRPVPSRDAAPPWAGVHGSLDLKLKRVVYSDAIQVSNITGRLRIEEGTLKLEALQAGVGETGRADLSGAVTFNRSAPLPYALAADVAVREFDPAPLFRALTGRETATIEGKFDVTSKLAGYAHTFSNLAAGAEGSFQITSKGGVFRGLPVDVGNIVENTSKLAAWIASAGTAITSIAGRKESADVANKAEAVAEFARALNPIPYDQLSVSLSRDAALNTTLSNFTLISPEVRLTGNGTALHTPGSCLLEDSLAMEFTLRARGRQGELLKYLGALEAQTDDLGYATCTVPLRVAGTLGQPDPSEVNSKLTALAIEKSGFGDKAAELLGKLRGGK